MNLFAAHGVNERDILGGKSGGALVSSAPTDRQLATEHVPTRRPWLYAPALGLRPCSHRWRSCRPQLAKKLNLTTVQRTAIHLLTGEDRATCACGASGSLDACVSAASKIRFRSRPFAVGRDRANAPPASCL